MADKEWKDIETVAYVVHEPGQDYQLEEVIIDEVRPDELLIDMKYSGLCQTDEVFRTGKIRICDYPAIFGHEGAGTILAVGSAVKNKDLKVGDAVLLSINYCERCEQCKTGHPSYCVEGTRYHLKGLRPSDDQTGFRLKKNGESVRAHFFGHSSFAKLSVVQETCVVKFPYPIEQAATFASMGCGYQTGAGTVLNILQPQPTQSIVIFGMGTVGLTAMMGAKYLKMRQIICVDIQDSKLKISKELGATDVINSKEIPDIVDHIKKLTGGGADFCVDCTGVPAVIEQMIAILGNLGTAATVGEYPFLSMNIPSARL